MFSVTLRSADRIRRYEIVHRISGWEVTLEGDGEVPQHICYHDWHRVERALARFRLEVSELTERGWREVRL
jgi:hypothetical protein